MDPDPDFSDPDFDPIRKKVPSGSRQKDSDPKHCRKKTYTWTEMMSGGPHWTSWTWCRPRRWSGGLAAAAGGFSRRLTAPVGRVWFACPSARGQMTTTTSPLQL